MPSARTRRWRWTAPLLVAAVVAVIAALPGLSAAGTPALAPLTAAELIAKIEQTKVTAFSGTLNLNPILGIPNLSALSAAGGGDHGGQGFDLTGLLSGSHKALVWVDGPQKERVALLQDLAETDLVRNGHDIWLWDSTTKKVTHYTVARSSSSEADGGGDTASTKEPVKTPQQAADDLLAHLDPSTAVSVGDPVTVADHDAYQLVLAPKSSTSTVDRVALAVDSATGFPLRIEVFAKGQKGAAVTLGFGQVTFATPAVSNFRFTPPPGSTLTSNTVGGAGHRAGTDTGGDKPDSAGSGQPTVVGEGWGSVAIFTNVTLPAQLNHYLGSGVAVSGAFGRGRVLETALVNVLVLDDGRVAVGAVTVSTLEAAIASAP